MLEHPLYSPDLASCDYFLFSTLKSELAGIPIHAKLVRVTKCIAIPWFAAAFRKWLERHENCVRLKEGYLEKNDKYFFAEHQLHISKLLFTFML